MAETITISQLRASAKEASVAARVTAQIDELTRREDRNGKPFWEIKLRDATDAFSLKAWSNSPNFTDCEELQKGEAVEINGEFATNAYGLDAQRWSLRCLSEEESAIFYAGSAEAIASNEEDFQTVLRLVESIGDPRLKGLSQIFLQELGPRFRRATAARSNHHAFRGGLLRHTAQMMKTADVLCVSYPRLNRDLLIAGVLFHDCGKLWETCPPEAGFEIPRELRGELLGHISIGIEIVNGFWRKLMLNEQIVEEWKTLTPLSEDVRTHLLHLIAAHHGELQFGSPILPKTPEAIALHYVDNMDARLEMFFSAYEKQPEVSAGVYDRVWALNVFPVRPLPSFAAATQVSLL